jgi:hypothetical protein
MHSSLLRDQSNRMNTSCWRTWFRLLTSLVSISIAPEAQRSLAPRFSVENKARIAFQPRRGDAKGRIVM